MTVKDIAGLLPANADIMLCPGTIAIPFNRYDRMDMAAYGAFKVVGIKGYKGDGEGDAATEYELLLAVNIAKED